ncbi:HDOD domain-containing protein [Rhodoferax sp. BAB1]|uniref:HDOD domain-containing protein n=1 Tax=Rhodoferax sp. BAB1 TaxID=2741720 RepID=UPI0015773BAE|nr:HDOD domain-containing protein [Rhodoferax sp. BAB1]QKO21740.1 HDOD domain-containing protein [Rhodoferax sp. BAB1]
MELNALLASPIVLPSIPKVVALLLSELDREVTDLKNITQLISTDPALTTRVLQTANTPLFRLSGKVNSAAEALAILELSHIRQMAAEAASAASLKGIPGINLPQFWVYSLNVAKLARSLAGVTRQNQGAAFTCGLIHAIGELVMHAGMPAEMAVLNKELGPLDLKRAKAEFLRFGYNYAHVGAAYARQWRFPQPMVDALEHQYAPFSNNVYEPLAGVIHLATWRARAREAQLNERALAVTFPGEVGEVLDLDIDMVLQQDPFDWSAHT